MTVSNGSNPSFSALRVESLESRDVPAASLQIINNSPFSNNIYDVYVNNAKYLDDIVFRAATPFSSVLDGKPLKIDIVSNSATTNSAPLFTTTFTLTANSSNIAVIVGDSSKTSGTSKLDLRLSSSARQAASSSTKTDVLVMHGSTDAPAVDLKIRGQGTVVNDIAYPSFATSYLTLAPANYTFDLALADGVTRVNSFAADLSGLTGKAVTVLASGLANPGSGSPGLGLLVVQADGNTRLLGTTRPWIDQTFSAGGVNIALLYNFSGQSQFTITPFASGSTSPARTAAADMNADGVPDLVVGAGPGQAPTVTVYDGKTQQIFRSFVAFETSFTGGVFIALGDIDGDTIPDISVTPDQGGGPRVTIFRGRDGQQIANFFGIEDPNFRGGARSALADVNGDGRPDVLVAAGAGGGPRIAGFDGASVITGASSPVKVFGDFFVFENTLRNGVFITGADMNNDSFADIIVGGGPGGGPRVFGVSGKDAVQNKQTQILNFFAGDQANRDGVRLAVKDLDGDYTPDLVVGLGSLGIPQVRSFRGVDVLATTNPGTAFDINPFSTNQPLGVFVG
jgi:hypothetical protein